MKQILWYIVIQGVAWCNMKIWKWSIWCFAWGGRAEAIVAVPVSYPKAEKWHPQHYQKKCTKYYSILPQQNISRTSRVGMIDEKYRSTGHRVIGADMTLLGLGYFSFVLQKNCSQLPYLTLVWWWIMSLRWVCVYRHWHYRYYIIEIYTQINLPLFLKSFGSNCNKIATSFARTMQW